MKKPRKAGLTARVGSPWYRLADVCLAFDISERTVWTWVSTGKLPEPQRRGKRWTRWPKCAIDAVLTAWGIAPAPESEVA